MKTNSLAFAACLGIIITTWTPVEADDSKVQPAVSQDPMTLLDDLSVLKKGDMLSVTIKEDNSKTKWIQVQTTQPAAGDVQFPYLGLVKAEGLTPKKLAEKCKLLLEKHHFKPATVIIALVEPEELQPGKVKKPPGGQN
ncbi:polysaccharide biosynthesis/export protein [Roseimicrobium gellanilyticum]|uniref:Polysaccharide biosynthesis/export protein n=1 Tax=Roseimicrobium gellanilyticum TaxID=748857 RepID=A0A366HRG1_9BACT|nr:polysaccharide biosynthesis/export family protein [Roseimicrobium gellanilyticum]RBP45839.1 polysaccharide biosynthesis/export protein [Roseimicrobium gellanilyticum]